jgi:Xaa-Pro aminopeptidase
LAALDTIRGLATHDAGGRDVRPDEPLQAGMVFACEPFAVYPSENLGVRVENTVFSSRKPAVKI